MWRQSSGPFAQFYETDDYILTRIIVCICSSFVFLMTIGMFPRILDFNQQSHVHRVEIRSSFSVWVDDRPFAQLEDGILSEQDVKKLTSMLAEERLSRNSSQVPPDSNDVVLLEAQKELEFKTIEQIVKACRSAGFSRFSFAVDGRP